MQIALALVGVVSSWVLLLLRIDPVPAWFLVVAWYPTPSYSWVGSDSRSAP